MKILFLIAISLIFMSSQTFANRAFLVQYLNGNRQYICIGANEGTGIFVDRKSLEVELHAPPIYILSIDVVEVPRYYRNPQNVEIERRYRVQTKFDCENRKMYINDNDDWKFVAPDDYYDEYFRTKASELAFALAYDAKFYGLPFSGYVDYKIRNALDLIHKK